MSDNKMLTKIWIDEKEILHTAGLFYGKWTSEEIDNRSKKYIRADLIEALIETKKAEQGHLELNLSGYNQIYYAKGSREATELIIEQLEKLLEDKLNE